jgi:DNA-binding response OmpR family regulator
MKNNPVLKQALSNLLIEANGFELFIGKATNLSELLDEFSKINPQIVLLDDSFPYDGNPLLIQISIIQPNIPIIVVSGEKNLLDIVRRETIKISSPGDLINTINLI